VSRGVPIAHELSHMLLRVEREEDDLELTYTEEELVVESIAFREVVPPQS
jgi:predicted N-acetyltransferase YhbS